MTFLDPYSGTNWETPRRTSYRRWFLLFGVLFLALAAVVFSRAATVVVSNYGDLNGEVWYAFHADYVSASPSWRMVVPAHSTQVFQVPNAAAFAEATGYYGGVGWVSINSYGTPFGSDSWFWLSVGGSGGGAASKGTGAPFSGGGGGSELSDADAAEVFRNGFFVGLGWELFGLILAVVRRIRSGTGMEG